MNNEIEVEEMLLEKMVDETSVADVHEEEKKPKKFSFGNREPTLAVAFMAILTLARGSQLCPAFYERAEEALRYVEQKLGLTANESVFMALLVDNYTEDSIPQSQLMRYLNMPTLLFLNYIKVLEGLESKGFVYSNHNRKNTSYEVPCEVVEAIRYNKQVEFNTLSELTLYELFIQFDTIFDANHSQEVTKKKIMALINHNTHLPFVKTLLGYHLDDMDNTVLVYIATQLAISEESKVDFSDLYNLFDERREWNHFHRLFRVERHELQKKHLVEYSNSEGFNSTNSICLSASARKELLPDISDSMVENEICTGLVKSNEIVAKSLYYDEEVERQVNELAELLDDNHYQVICGRLREKGFRCGFTCLFYGAPGTGKTETVMQLARRTGRDIMQVDFSELKSKWVGDSEKNVKAVFDQYRQRVKACKKAPILLFNEADAVINKRLEMVERSVDKMENALQNIILQEIETLDGILIATTNLVQNLDNAFERRFLYKLRFNQPTMEARRHIWHTMIPSLEDSTIEQLASKYDFSGGQIENIARHYTIDTILHGESSQSLTSLFQHCNQEKLVRREKKRIGF